MPNLQPWELLLILAVILLLFGAKRLPDAARGLGRSMRIFKAETKGLRDDDREPETPARPVAIERTVEPMTAPATPAPPPVQAPASAPVQAQAPVQAPTQAPVQGAAPADPTAPADPQPLLPPRQSDLHR